MSYLPLGKAVYFFGFLCKKRWLEKIINSTCHSNHSKWGVFESNNQLVSLPPGLSAIADNRDLVNTSEFAKVFNVASQTVRKNYSQNGVCFGIRPIKVGNTLLWPVEGISRLLVEGGCK